MEKIKTGLLGKMGMIGIGMSGFTPVPIPVGGKGSGSHDLPSGKQIISVVVILLILVSVGYFLTRPAAVQQNSDTDPADTLTKNPSDDGGGLGSLLAASASASTVPLTTDTGEVINVPIVVQNKYEETAPLNSIDIKNLKYNSVDQKITGEIKSGSSKEIYGVVISVISNTNSYLSDTQTSLPEKRSPSGMAFQLQNIAKENLIKAKIVISLPVNY